MAATSAGIDENASRTYLAESLKRFCRSIELCDSYLRGFYGLKIVSRRDPLIAICLAVLTNARSLQSC